MGHGQGWNINEKRGKEAGIKSGSVALLVLLIDCLVSCMHLLYFPRSPILSFSVAGKQWWLPIPWFWLAFDEHLDKRLYRDCWS